MKKLLLLSTLFLAFACTVDDNEEEPSLYDKPFLEHVDGLSFVRMNYNFTYFKAETDEYITANRPVRDKYLFFYDSDIFLKEVIVYYPELDSYCSTTKEGTNTDDGFNFTAEILRNEQVLGGGDALDVLITYTGENGNTVSSTYEYRQVCNTIDCFKWRIRVTDDGISKTYSETSMTHASLCN